MSTSKPSVGDSISPPAPEATPAVSQVRSTILMASQRRLREVGHYERYAAQLSPPHKATLLELAAPCWLPIAVGFAHYTACDALGVPEREVVAAAQNLAMHGQGTFLGIAANVARGAGVTPWTLAAQAPRLWARAFSGGSCAAAELGPKDLRVEVTGWSCATIPYCRWAFRGLVLGLVKLVAREAHVRELRFSALRPAHEITLQVSWA